MTPDTAVTGVSAPLGGQAVDAMVPSRRKEQVAPAPARRREDRIADLLGRAAVVSLFTVFVTAILMDFGSTGHVTGLLLVVSEGLVVVLTLVRRNAAWMDRSWRARLLTAVSMAGPPLVRPIADGGLLPDGVTFVLSGAGLVVVLLGKLSLGRSFGLMPANRGVVRGGIYRLVRHPIYAGYIITHVGFVIANPTAWNLSMLFTADLALLVRAIQEERTLALDPLYVEYQQKVRWRVLPGVF